MDITLTLGPGEIGKELSQERRTAGNRGLGSSPMTTLSHIGGSTNRRSSRQGRGGAISIEKIQSTILGMKYILAPGHPRPGPEQKKTRTQRREEEGGLRDSGHAAGWCLLQYRG